jgi:DNA-binding CsgD family transcriptional regulator
MAGRAMPIPTIHSDNPDRMRQEVVERLCEATNARCGLYYETAEVDEQLFCVKMTGIGSARHRKVVRGLEGTRLPGGAAATTGRRIEQVRRDGWTIHRARRAELTEFRLLRDDLIREDLFDLPVWHALYEPAGITTDHLRLLTFESGRYVGWLGVFRQTAESQFDVVHKARANRLRAELRHHLRAARALETPDDSAGGSLLFAACGRLLFASNDMRDLSEETLDILRRAVRRADRDALEGDVVAFGRTAARLVRMDAPDRVAYLVSLEPAQPASLRLRTLLTPRQLEVAELAATGATIETVADALEIKATTVKYHLREAYRRLHIETRAELAALLAS